MLSKCFLELYVYYHVLYCIKPIFMPNPKPPNMNNSLTNLSMFCVQLYEGQCQIVHTGFCCWPGWMCQIKHRPAADKCCFAVLYLRSSFTSEDHMALFCQWHSCCAIHSTTQITCLAHEHTRSFNIAPPPIFFHIIFHHIQSVWSCIPALQYWIIQCHG